MSREGAVRSLQLASSYLEDVDASLVGEAAGDQAVGFKLRDVLKRAEEQVALAEQADPSAEFNDMDANFLRACVLEGRGRVEALCFDRRAKAISYLQESLKLYEDIAVTHATLGQLYMASGKKADSVRHLRRAVELEPDNVELRKMLDEGEHASASLARVGAFHGSWKVLLALLGIGAFGLTAAIGANEVPGAIVWLLFWGGCAGLYWKVKSR